MAHFEALYDHPPPTILKYDVGTNLVHEVDRQLLRRNDMLHQLKTNLHAASN